MRRIRGLWVLLAAAAVGVAGCLQIETRVALHEDGSATITEKVRFSRRLLDLEKDKEPAARISRWLEKEGALKRVQHLGKGVVLVSHAVADTNDGGRESTAVYRIPDIADLVYACPFLALGGYSETETTMRCKVQPDYDGALECGDGYVTVSFYPEFKQPPGRRAPATKPREPSPAEIQVYRELQPVFRDMLKGFRLKFTFESYAPIGSPGGLRGRYAGVKHTDLINVTDEDLDRYQGKFFENEEIMVDLIQWDLGSKDVMEHTADCYQNETEPLFSSGGRNARVAFRPSRHYFDKYFVGKTLRNIYRRPQERPARFEEIGYPPPGKEGKKSEEGKR